MTFRDAGTLRVVLGFLLLVCAAVLVLAAILCVPQEYASIQAVLAAARAGDVALVAPGHYVESLTMPP